MPEQTADDAALEQAIIALIKEQGQAESVTFEGASPIADPFNEVSKANPPDEATEMSFQIGEKDGKLSIYGVWDYSIFQPS